MEVAAGKNSCQSWLFPLQSCSLCLVSCEAQEHPPHLCEPSTAHPFLCEFIVLCFWEIKGKSSGRGLHGERSSDG